MDKVIDLILSQLIFNVPATIGTILLLITFIIQLYFYIVYYNKPIAVYKVDSKKYESNFEIIKPSVSVIIVAKNESENLAKNLPYILDQDYLNFEVIIVNDGSTDESQNYLELLSKKEKRLYSTFLPLSQDRDGDRRRIICLTLGIKAAKNDILLFTDAGATPFSRNWISSMVKHMDNNIEVVLGYSNLVAPKSFWEKICRFDNLIFSLQYFSMAIKKKPFFGTYRNIAYKKELFFENKGFSKALNFEYADEVFLNQIMTSNNTAVALDEDSYIKIDIENYAHWKTLKNVYYRSKKYFKKQTAKRFNLELVTRYLLYILGISVIIYSLSLNLWIYSIIAIVIILSRNIIQLSVLKKASNHYKLKPLCMTLPFIDLIQPLYVLSANNKNRTKSKWRR